MKNQGIHVNISDLNLKNPTMLAAGMLGISAPSLRRIARAGAGALVTKSISLDPKKGNPNPTIVETECGFLNALGLPNPGIEDFKSEIADLKNEDIPIIVSIFGKSPGEFAQVALEVEKAGGNAVELNISCPHEEIGQIGQNPQLTAKVVRAVKEIIKIPVFVKLTPNVTEIKEIALAAEKAGANAVTAINTLRAMTIDIETGYPILFNRYGGLSGPAIRPLAVRCIYEIYETAKIPIIGAGGVSNWKDAIELILAGASAVQIGTILRSGLSVFKEIKDGIKSYLKAKNLGSISQIIGLAHRR
ncbi:MAG: dihydroorotate dehydrogenase [Candidatus Hodarchaeota archaeon]